ncbi:MAG: choice-of-anchor tandem repeat GloVer-containing protein [Rhodospirillales bacterium]
MPPARFTAPSPAAAPAIRGAVYRLVPPEPGKTAWKETLLHSFRGDDGSGPIGGLIADASGALYGTTGGGGALGYGTVFRLTPPTDGGKIWKETVLYSFSGAADGGNVSSPLLADASGALYGIANYGGDMSCDFGNGCGVVFKLTPPKSGKPKASWTQTVLHTFSGTGDAMPSRQRIARRPGHGPGRHPVRAAPSAVAPTTPARSSR